MAPWLEEGLRKHQPRTFVQLKAFAAAASLPVLCHEGSGGELVQAFNSPPPPFDLSKCFKLTTDSLAVYGDWPNGAGELKPKMPMEAAAPGRCQPGSSHSRLLCPALQSSFSETLS